MKYFSYYGMEKYTFKNLHGVYQQHEHWGVLRLELHVLFSTIMSVSRFTSHGLCMVY